MKMGIKCYSVFFLGIISCIFIQNVASISTLNKPVDLTWHFENNTIYWTGVQPFKFTKMLGIITEQNYWVALNEFCAGEHGGTHIDAPYHFDKNGIKVGEIPIDKLIVPGAIVDMSEEVARLGPNTTLQVHHLKKWEEEHGPFEHNSLVLIKFGYSKHYPNKKAYLGSDVEGEPLEFPGISPEAAAWLADCHKFVGVGVDTASVDPGFSKTSDAHRILCGKGLYLVESAKLLEDLPARDFTFLALPMNIAEGTGAPLRLVAVPEGYV